MQKKQQENIYARRANKAGIPDHMVDGVVRYIVDKIPPGSFLSAVINNELKEAYISADDINSHHLRNYVQFFYSSAPAGCWGFSGAVSKWIDGEKVK